MASPSSESRPKVRSGQPTSDSVHCWSDQEERKATGLFQLLDELGNAQEAPALAAEEQRRLYEGMLKSRLLDERLSVLQRQGRISHYFEARGQEAAVVAAAHVLTPTDYFVPSLREGAAALYRGMPLAAYLAQMLGTKEDRAHGRQMPCHVSSLALRHVSTSSCVATQIPHAVGLAWAAKIRKEPVVTLCFFGDGATSEDDFHAGMNFAAVNQVPVIFVCQNNQWAISTPVAVQTQSQSFALKGLSYGIPSLRVDGNDVFALVKTLAEAVDQARSGKGPRFVESVTYRLGAHASADEPSLYRSDEETKHWQAKDPILRHGLWLNRTGLLPHSEQEVLRKKLDNEIQAAIAQAESMGRPEAVTLFNDVTSQPTWQLTEDRRLFLDRRPR